MEGRGGLLLARRGAPPHEGTWDLPGGFLESGELPDRGLRRELREELSTSGTSSGAFTDSPSTATGPAGFPSSPSCTSCASRGRLGRPATSPRCAGSRATRSRGARSRSRRSGEALREHLRHTAGRRGAAACVDSTPASADSQTTRTELGDHCPIGRLQVRDPRGRPDGPKSARLVTKPARVTRRAARRSGPPRRAPGHCRVSRWRRRRLVDDPYARSKLREKPGMLVEGASSRAPRPFRTSSGARAGVARSPEDARSASYSTSVFRPK